MMTLVGFIVVIVSVFGGFMLEGGHMAVLFQPIELLIIGGSALGSLIAACSTHLLKQTMAAVAEAFKGPVITQEKYLQLVKLIFELFKLAAGNPLAIEQHVDNPHQSAIFSKYPLITHDHHAVDFIANTLLLHLSASIAPHDLDDLLDTDIKTLHEAELMIPKTISRVGDALPGLGIVAAVLGVVITMGKLTQGKEVIGHSVAAALVGTFLGILLSYGFAQPLSAKIETNIEDKGKILQVIKVAILAFAKGCNAKVCAEFARRSIPDEFRPSWKDLDKAIATVKG